MLDEFKEKQTIISNCSLNLFGRLSFKIQLSLILKYNCLCLRVYFKVHPKAETVHVHYLHFMIKKNPTAQIWKCHIYDIYISI